MDRMRVDTILILVLATVMSGYTDETPHDINDFPATETGSVSLKTHRQYLFNITAKKHVMRVIVESNEATPKLPILVVVRSAKEVISWSVPLFVTHNIPAQRVARTLCPLDHDAGIEMTSVELSTSSPTPVSYNLTIIRMDHDNFHLRMGEPQNLTASPSEPRYIMMEHTDDEPNAIVEVHSSDETCMIVALQGVNCPVHDQATTVFFNSTYQSMTTNAAIEVERGPYPDPKFYVVFVVLADDRHCTQVVNKKGKSPTKAVEKNFTVVMRRDFSDREIHIAIGSTLALFLAIYIICIIISFLVRNMDEKERVENEERIRHECEMCEEGNEGSEWKVSLKLEKKNDEDTETTPIRESAPLARDEKALDPAEVQDLVLTPEQTKKICLTVKDLARKSWNIRDKRYATYYWQVVIVALIYVPPVVQLVVAWEYASHFTGNQDMCYYNFLCKRRWWKFSAFNNIFSNIGYVLLGFLYILLVKNRSASQKKQMCRNPLIDQEYGVPKHYGLFYALGTCLVIEGIMSGCYHVCPNNNNFQFDTAFMYIMGALGILKVYQIRHPDISASSYIAFVVLAMAILISVLGVGYSHSLAFWIIFSICYLMLLVTLSVELYYKGEYHLGPSCFKRFFSKRRACANWCMPSHPDRIVFLTIGNFLNLFFIGLGLSQQPNEFGTFMLGIFIANLLLYTAYYLCMKMKYKEKLHVRTMLYIALAGIFWGPALYFFFSVKYDTGVSPAESRRKNAPCLLLNYYDVHDIWHFLSALSLFFSWLVILNIDDDLNYVPRSQIPVF